MIGASREVEKDWAEFESYATNLYARSVVANQPLSISGIVPSKLGPEQQSSSDMTMQSSAGYLDIQLIADELASVRKAVLDLRTYSEEVRLDYNHKIIIIMSFSFVIER